jgi:hypothetical protein
MASDRSTTQAREWSQTGRDACHANYNGGHTAQQHCNEAFHHGMDTVWNVIEGTLPALLDAARAEVLADAERLRKLLWLRHGCSFSALYGDDGEMQCSACGIDFKRAPAEDIEAQWERIGLRRLAESGTGEVKP